MKVPMQDLVHRLVDKKESAGLGVESGWYGTKVSGTFVTGPHPTEAECVRKVAEMNRLAGKAAS
jgi:hypothetical protein